MGNNELVRTKTLVKNAIVVIDAAPFRQWYESHYAQPLARKKGAKLTDAEEAVLNRKMSKRRRASTQSCRSPARLRSLFLISSRPAVSSPPSPPGLASAAGVTDTSLRARSWSST